jgi:hypothetical protein
MLMVFRYKKLKAISVFDFRISYFFGVLVDPVQKLKAIFFLISKFHSLLMSMSIHDNKTDSHIHF